MRQFLMVVAARFGEKDAAAIFTSALKLLDFAFSMLGSEMVLEALIGGEVILANVTREHSNRTFSMHVGKMIDQILRPAERIPPTY